MVDLHSILAEHRSKNLNSKNSKVELAKNQKPTEPTTSEIPDLFFDQILINFKLSRVEILCLMYLYRTVWCRPNLYKSYGLSQLLSHSDMAKVLGISMDEVLNSIRKLEGYGFITTVRAGQYFVRKYFIKENDEKFGQTYDDFEV